MCYRGNYSRGCSSRSRWWLVSRDHIGLVYIATKVPQSRQDAEKTPVKITVIPRYRRTMEHISDADPVSLTCYHTLVNNYLAAPTTTTRTTILTRAITGTNFVAAGALPLCRPPTLKSRFSTGNTKSHLRHVLVARSVSSTTSVKRSTESSLLL